MQFEGSVLPQAPFLTCWTCQVLLILAEASQQCSAAQVAAYEFTTLTCIPGVVHYRGAKIQMLDLPGIIEGAKD